MKACQSDYFFDGELSASKSLYNRALIIQSYNKSIQLLGHSVSDDVVLMQKALNAVFAKATGSLDCGHAGTVLRFLAFRCSRLEGAFVLTGSERLFSRPQKELIKLLSQLGCDVEQSKDRLKIQSYGWKLRGDGVFVDSSQSSQFASGLLLNTWDLDKDFYFHLNANRVSEAYFQMTLDLVKAFGLKVHQNGQEFMVAAKQQPMASSYHIEVDLSSAFVMAALSQFTGPVRVRNFPSQPLQPDLFFVSCLKQMGFQIQQSSAGLEIHAAKKLVAIKTQLINSPDLFPVLSVLCAFAEGESIISGVSHLEFKESNRLQKSKELLSLIGADMQINKDQVRIIPGKLNKQAVEFNPDQDHRMAMAAALAVKAGAEIRILNKEVVSKSFPEFWSLAFS